MKDETSDDDDDETIDLRELDKPAIPGYAVWYPKNGSRLMIGNSTADLDEPGVITVRVSGSN
jgi:hypothetical protein